MPANVQCIQCGKTQTVIPARVSTYKFCSIKCRADWRRVAFKGAGNPKWQGGSRFKACQHCGKEYTLGPTMAYSTFVKSKFCSKPCADVAGFRYSGEAHPSWTGGRHKRSKGYKRWTVAVISRDLEQCTKCGAKGVELHAHHLKSWKEFPELRLDVANGITVCAPCHWAIHSASNENGENSVDTLRGNTEPSLNGNILEGVTTRGRAYRRWAGKCDWCGAFLSKRLSDKKKLNFCGYSCSGKHRYYTGITTFGRQ